MRFLRPTLAVAVACALIAAAVTSAPAQAARRGSSFAWASAASAAVHPGIMTYTAGSQCTANFVFTRGSEVLLGQAAHCAGTGAATATNGCTASTLPLGQEVQDVNGNFLGTIVYSSWVAMQNLGETDPDLCNYNDFALIRLTTEWVSQTNPSVPIYGGPTGVRTSGLAILDDVYAIGNSSLRLGISQLSNHHGYSVQELGNGWSHQVYTVTPGIPGDSGGPLLAGDGSAVGLLSTVGLYPLVLSNNFSDLSRVMGYARAHGMSGLYLVKGDIGFTPSLI